MLTRTRDEWMQIFSGTDSCVTPVISMDEVCEQAWVKDRDMIYTLPNFRDSGSELKIVGQPIKLSETPAEVKAEFPGLGEHGEEILAMIGYSKRKWKHFGDKESLVSHQVKMRLGFYAIDSNKFHTS